MAKIEDLIKRVLDATLRAELEHEVKALKREKKTFEYKAYPEEGHGLLLRKNQLDFYAMMERFVDWYLL